MTRISWAGRFGLAAIVLLSLGAKPNRSPAPGIGPVAAVSEPAREATSGSLVPAPHEREVAALVGEMLEMFHYEKLRVDDTISRRWFDNYIDTLDWGRSVFLKADMDEFMAFRDQFDDDLHQKPPRLDRALRIHDRYQERMRERAAFAMKVLEKPLDLTNAETMAINRHEAKLPWPSTTDEANDLWRQRTEDEVINALLDGRDTEEQIRDRLLKRYDRLLKSLSDTESADVLERWLGALTRAYDPHSIWMKPAANDEFDIGITNSVQGIGASLSSDGENTTVDEVIAGGPASRDGRIRKDDRILMVAQDKGEPIDIVGMRLDKVVKLIRGEKGSKVTLTVEHADGIREVILLVRDQVMLERSAAEHHIEEVGGKRIGIVDLPSFYVDPSGKKTGRRAAEDVRKALVDLRAGGAEGVVFDLRGNGGGSLVEAIDVTGLFLSVGPVVQVRDRDGRIEALHDGDPSVAWSGPLVVLTDATSASASEIVAGALQDYGRAIIVGDERTHGKGTVQQIAPLTPSLRGRYSEDVGGALKLTVQKFYRVSGGSTQNKGVEPDVVLPSRWDGLDVHEQDLPFVLAWDRIPPAPHARAGQTATAIPELIQRSAARRKENADFGRLTRLLEERKALEAETTVSLVLATRMAETEAREARAGTDPHGNDRGDEVPSEDERDRLAREADFTLTEGIAVLLDWMSISAR